LDLFLNKKFFFKKTSALKKTEQYANIVIVVGVNGPLIISLTLLDYGPVVPLKPCKPTSSKTLSLLFWFKSSF